MASTAPTVSTADASQLSPPSGTTTTTNRCLPGVNGPPEDCDVNGPKDSAYPVLEYQGHTFWPLSYDNNDFAFAIVITPSGSTNVLGQFNAPGARYIESISVYSGNQTVSFWGQGFAASMMPWSDLASHATSVGGGSGNPSTSGSPPAASNTGQAGSSATGTGTAPATTSSTAPGGGSGSSSVSGGAIAGIVIGGVVGVFLAVVIISYFASTRVRIWINDKFGEKPGPEPEPSGKPESGKPGAGKPGAGEPGAGKPVLVPGEA